MPYNDLFADVVVSVAVGLLKLLPVEIVTCVFIVVVVVFLAVIIVVLIIVALVTLIQGYPA